MKNTRKNIMKPKKDKNFYITRAVRRFVKVMHYYNITRVKNEKSYHIDGKFNLDKFKHQMKFLNDWNSQTKAYRKQHAKVYSDYSKVFNYTLCIPYELIEKVLGTYRDESGVYHNISLEEVENILIGREYLKVIESGKKFNRDKSGNYSVKCWWQKKYLFANEKHWYKMINSNNYDNWWDFIKEEDDKGFHKIWLKWVKPNNIKTETKEENEVIEEKVENTTEVNTNNNNTKNEDKEMVSNDVKKDLAGKAIRVLLTSGIINPETAVQWMKDFVYRSGENKFTIDEAMVEYNSDKVEENDKNKVIEHLLKYLSDMGMTHHDGIYIMTEYLKAK